MTIFIVLQDSISFDEVLQENLEKIPAHPIVICYGKFYGCSDLLRSPTF